MFHKEDKRCVDCEFARASTGKISFLTGKRKCCIGVCGYICEKDPLKPVAMGLRGRCSDREQNLIEQYPSNN